MDISVITEEFMSEIAKNIGAHVSWRVSDVIEYGGNSHVFANTNKNIAFVLDFHDGHVSIESVEIEGEDELRETIKFEYVNPNFIENIADYVKNIWSKEK